MSRPLLIIIVLHLAMPGFGQVITGRILNQETQEPIDFASLHFDGTFVGTTTDSMGNFKLDVTKYASRPLVVSAVGYYANAITAFTPGQNHLMYLNPRVFEIKEVTVSTKSLVRKRRDCMRIFRNEFIGLTSNARRCYILNEQDITFNYASDKDTIRAYASRPLHIENLSLGYVITYYLDCFEYVRESETVTYFGSIVFNKDLATDEMNITKYLKRRDYAYKGSSKHFFRALWADSLKVNRFSLKDYKTEQALYASQVVSQDSLGRKYLHYPEELAIYYESHVDFLSYINFLEEKVYFEQDGFFDPRAIMWNGRMSEQRIADFLPYEYRQPE